MKKTMNPTRELYNVLLAIYGEDKRNLAIHATINDIHYDRWGTKADITLIDGTHVVGRLSKKMRKFNGKINEEHKRSFRFNS